MQSTSEVRRKFIEYFIEKNHAEINSSSLIPADDPTLLFVNAGMVQFKDIFLGAEKRKYSRAVTSQRCVRAGGKHNDLDQVGYTARHHTFFEMLGNFSFGDYFKKDAISYAWDFLTNVLQIPKEKLLVTVFESDDEAEKIWIDEIGIASDKVLRIGAKDNFWQMGDTGPCGPCSEIFYDHGEEIAGGPPGTPEEDGDRFIEIWNLVFMQFDKQLNGDLLPLPKPCVDTGMGLERITSILQGQHNNYNIDLFQHIIQYTVRLLNVQDVENPSLKVVADHIRTCSFLISDGIQPSNEGRGYVLRRIIRRAIRHGHKLGATETFFYKILQPLIEVMNDAYPELATNKQHIAETLKKEEERFAETLETGMTILTKAIEQTDGKIITGETAFKLYDTYGFPLDLTQDVAREHGLTVDELGFDTCMQQQKTRSKASGGFAQSNQLPAEIVANIKATKFTGYTDLTGSATIVAIIHESQPLDKIGKGGQGMIVLDKTPFYAESGGQIGDTGVIVKDLVKINVLDTQKAAGQYHMHVIENSPIDICVGEQVKLIVDKERRESILLNHSATHLLHKVLQEKFGTHVQQKGSIVSNDKLRFDFSHPDAINHNQLNEIEIEVNKHIRMNYLADTQLMPFDQALEVGAMALFGEKYGEEVRVLNFGGYSVELCGGTHVKSTGQIGLFKIVSESSIAAGVRRIEAVTGKVAIELMQSQEGSLKNIMQHINATINNVEDKAIQLLQKNKDLEKKILGFESKLAGNAAQDLLKNVQKHNNIHYLFEVLQNSKVDAMRTIVDSFKDKYTDGVIVLANHNNDDKVQLICTVTKSLAKIVKAGDVVRTITAKINGKGGGRPDFAQGGGVSSLDNLKQELDNYLNEIKNLVNNE